MDPRPDRRRDQGMVQVSGQIEGVMANPEETVKSARDKIRPLADLAAVARQAQDEGRKVVLCHGVFDLVHMGHVRHFEAAHREGDVLIVTLTADRYVNKGPGRPIFPEPIRAEMVAAIEYVDYVAINDHPTSEPVLDTVRPDVYVKGSDYENPEDDVTGKILAEREVVEKHGGRIVFTKDITYSSSSLINRYLNVYDRPLQDFLEGMRDSAAEERLSGLISKAESLRVLLVGDCIIDDYQYASPMGKSAKENMISTCFQSQELFAGGVIAAANHVADYCSEVAVITMLGETDSYEDLIRGAIKKNVSLHTVRRPEKCTTRKTRFVDPAYMRKLFEVYFFEDSPPSPEIEAEVNTLVAELAPNYDLVIVTDFGHGLIQPSTIDVLSEKAKFLAINAQTNSANVGYNLITKYPRADYICIDAPEAQLAMGDRFSEIESLIVEKLAKAGDYSRIIVTHGKYGCVTWDRQAGIVRIPAFTKTVVDTVGAGDAFFAITAPMVANGGHMVDAGFIGNAAGAIKVNIVGHRRSVEKIPLLRFITTLLK